MKLLQAIDMADSLCPNAFSLEEKLRWCEEVTAGIRRDIKKVYTSIETTAGGGKEIDWPDEFSFEDLELAFWNGTPMDKLDLRSLLVDPSQYSTPGKLRLVFLQQPQSVRQLTVQGEFDLSENFIRMPDAPFEAGDFLEWVPLSSKDAEPDWSNPNCACVIDRVYDGLLFDADIFTPQTAAPIALRRVIDDHTEVDEAPYDGMYVEYLLAKMALYQHDYTAYGAHMAQYNSLYDALRRDYKTRNPLTCMSGFRHYW